MWADGVPLTMTTTLIAASAGTGKTFRICELITARLIAGVDPARLLATTFTRKAAGELSDRIRAHLLRAPGLGVELRDRLLDRLELSAIGTVHSVAHRLLTRFALPLGLSPTLDILDDSSPDGEANRHVRRVLQEQLPPQWEAFEAVCDRLSVNAIEEAVRLLQLMRANAMSTGTLAQGLGTSLSRWRNVIGTPIPNHPGMDQSRSRAEQAITAITALQDATKVTQEALQKLRGIARVGTTTWKDQAALAKLAAGARSGANDLLEPIRALGRSVRTAPGLHEDLERFADLAPRILAQLDQAYGAYKRERGLVDFTDLEYAFLDLVRNPTLRPALREEVTLFVVDEFQDTNPIQLAIFRALHELAAESVWVGDRKQAIYGFRGTDAALVEGIWTALSGGPGVTQERLTQNRRSQGGIVGITNALFAPIFGAQDVTVNSEKPTLPNACERWAVPKKTADNVAAIAAGVAALVRTEPRRQPRDIAILLFTRARTQDQAAALRNLGIPAVVPLPGLLATREGAIVHAAVRVAADRRDSLACTEVIHLLGTSAPDQTPAWFAGRFQEVQPSSSPSVPYPTDPILAALAAIPTPQLAAADVVRAVIAACDLPSRLAGWGSPADRATNLDALVDLAVRFEEEAVRDGKPSTPAGLVAFWDGLAADAADLIPVPSGTNAVQLLTYHAAKGLQWPVVICGHLNFEPKPRMFESVVIGGDPAAADPLAGRHLAYWVWPFGRNPFSGVPLDPVGLIPDAQATPEGQEAGLSATAEMQRLLYVGCTRAQDTLILATTGDDGWLDLLGPHVTTVLGLATAPSPEGKVVPTTTTPATTMVHRSFTPAAPNSSVATASMWVQEPPPRADAVHPARWESPSAAPGPVQAEVVATESTGGPPLQILSAVDGAALGSAIHTYLASIPSLERLPLAAKIERAASILTTWGVSGCVHAAHVVASGDALYRWIAHRWPGSHAATEAPMEALRPDGGWWRGTIDLAVVAPSGEVLAIIDHKATGGMHPKPIDALEYAPQLHAYRAVGTPATELWIHHSLAGTCAQVVIR